MLDYDAQACDFGMMGTLWCHWAFSVKALEKLTDR
jgi:hypothetical protein